MLYLGWMNVSPVFILFFSPMSFHSVVLQSSRIKQSDKMLPPFEVRSDNTNFQTNLNSLVEEDGKMIGQSMFFNSGKTCFITAFDNRNHSNK